jgi:general nucleoside transport system ATP-binding protein
MMKKHTLKIKINSLKINKFLFFLKPVILLNHDDHVTLEVNSGEMTLIRGNNGTGKSTLIQSFYGEFIKSLDGEITLNGTRKESIDTASYMTYSPQKDPLYRYYKDERVFDFLMDQKGSQGTLLNKNLILDKLVKFFDHQAEEIAAKKFKQLSDGQQKIIRTIKTLLANTPFYAFDEPINDLDNDKSKALMNEFELMMSQGKGILIISHCMIYLKPNHVYVIENKKLKKETFSFSNHPCEFCKRAHSTES